MARDAADNLPKRTRTDRMKSYPSAIKRVFNGKVEHVQTDGLAAVVNNNLIERLNRTVKERDKVFRGFKRLESAQQYVDGWALDYNFFGPHLSLGGKTTPRVRLGPSLPSSAGRTWPALWTRWGRCQRPRGQRKHSDSS